MIDPLKLLEEKESNFVVYEDGVAFAVLQKEGVSLGHVKIYPKKKIRYMEELSDEESGHLFFIASYVATAIFEGIGAHGTNIIINNGIEDKHLDIDVIPRTEGDGINFQWEPMHPSPEELDEVQKRLKEHTDYIGLQVADDDEIPTVAGEEEETDEEDYRIKSLYRQA